MLLENLNMGFIGGGAMAEALIAGLTGAGLVPPERIRVSDVSGERTAYLRDKFGVVTVSDNDALVGDADIIVLAVKPFVVGEVLAETGGRIGDRHTVISIAAGISTSFIEQKLVGKVPVIRVMPNTPALVGAGATAVCRGRWASDRHLELALTMFGAVGRAVPVSENLMDAVTGLSGSGPAYMYIIAEALADAGVRVGLPRDVALTLAAQTMLGAARMILETGRHPGVLKDMVTTPGGTTIEGLFALEEGGLRAALVRAVERATARSRQLSGEDKK
ncbi:pyrroline-5-carboxylate reductase [Desulfallas sp. Bu1-1]|uniref:pyrroline-5-carboxylate reductase n=1 Tax=Desulfallas sp. Bu1-1 TaxID=2787620 RepID=UPI00189ED7CE|nr:pyrroline-5-carboxylate reductase [Desulfallas sp. Bu1-1]MBF7083182.1 pyrroline-5-carboxylate reductase [Desulfallas sp. Bu1-1]